MNKMIYFLIMFLVLSLPLTAADGFDFNETKRLIESGISCDKLTEDQLETIGDYYMELMHPGEQHEIMDRMMGGEGSATLRQMHINMALRLYCGQNVGGMMGMMGGYNMMQNVGGYNMMQGMMGGWNSGWLNFWSFLAMLFFIGLIILVYLGIIKLWKDVFQSKRR